MWTFTTSGQFSIRRITPWRMKHLCRDVHIMHVAWGIKTLNMQPGGLGLQAPAQVKRGETSHWSCLCQQTANRQSEKPPLLISSPLCLYCPSVFAASTGIIINNGRWNKPSNVSLPYLMSQPKVCLCACVPACVQASMRAFVQTQDLNLRQFTTAGTGNVTSVNYI